MEATIAGALREGRIHGIRACPCRQDGRLGAAEQVPNIGASVVVLPWPQKSSDVCPVMATTGRETTRSHSTHAIQSHPMTWRVEALNETLDRELDALPADMQARLRE